MWQRSQVWVALLFLMVVGAQVRLASMRTVVRSDRLHINDPDTLRRLVRIEHLVELESDVYPFVNAWDGYPGGSTSHWTFPMDGVIIGLDTLFSRMYPQARPFESGAVWAGPILGTLAIGILFLLLHRFFGMWVGLLVTGLYAISHNPAVMTRFGNGDHQALQHLCVVAALAAFVGTLFESAHKRLAGVAGLSLGLGLWVSTETSIVLYAMTLTAFVTLVMAPPDQRGRLLGRHLTWAAAVLFVALLADRLEHPIEGITFEWDKVSGFQIYQLLVICGFFGLGIWFDKAKPRWTWQNATVSAVIALVVGYAPFLILSSWEGALGVELSNAAKANLWAQNEVDEYRPLMSIYGFFVPAQLWERYGFAIFLLPVCLIGWLLDSERERGTRLGVVVLTSALFGFACYEMKLGHLFAIVYPLALVGGGFVWLTRIYAKTGMSANAQRTSNWIASLALLGCFYLAAPEPPSRNLSNKDKIIDLLVREVRGSKRPTAQRASILAPWSVGAELLYHGHRPVVASGYHRNLDGIRDAYEFFSCQYPGQRQRAEEILRDRQVAWVITSGPHEAFFRASLSFPDLGQLARLKDLTYLGHGAVRPQIDLIEEAKGTLLVGLHFAGPSQSPIRLGRLELHWQAEIPARNQRRPGNPPTFSIWRVEDVESR